MAIPVWDKIVGIVDIRAFDQGVMTTMNGALNQNTPPPNGPPLPCYSVSVPMPNGTVQNVPAYFSQPDTIYRYQTFPYITIDRPSFTPAMRRWMGVGQLEYRAGVSGTQMVIGGVSGYAQHQTMIQPFPFDITYVISAVDKYEQGVQPILTYLLRAFPPLGKLYVVDSLGLPRTYESYLEGEIANLENLIDPVNRIRGYSLTIRVEGELDLADPVVSDAALEIDLNLHIGG